MSVDLTSISKPIRRTMLAMHISDSWLTFSELPAGITSMALTLLCVRQDPWIERRRTQWGGEHGQKPGAGYEYRMTNRGREIRAALAPR